MPEKKKTRCLYIRNIPDDLKREFKAVCTRNGKTMTEEVIEFMKKHVSTIYKPW